MPTRTFAVAAAGVGVTVLATTGITFASPPGSAPDSASAHRAAASVRQAAQPVQRAAQPVRPAVPDARADQASGDGGAATENGDSHDREGGGRDNGGHDSSGRDNGGHDSSGRDGGGHDSGRDDGGRKDEGRIYFNERSYSAFTDGCITAASGLGSSSFNIFNDSRKTVEVFRGFTCDNGSPVATVGPHGATNGVVTSTVHDDLPFGGEGLLFGDDGVVGSFRVISDYDEW